MIVSVFNGNKDTTNPHYATAEALVKRIMSDRDRSKILNIRNESDVKARRTQKGLLPCILWSGKFTKREDESISEHSGLVCLDFDHIEDVAAKKADLIKLPFVFACFVSPSGDGLKVIVRVPALAWKHRGYYRGLMKLFPDLDPTSQNESRVCYISWDENCYYNPECEEFTDFIPLEQPKTGTTSVATYTNYTKIEVAVKMIRNSVRGQQHDTLLKASKLMGGYIAGGLIEESVAINALEHEISKKEIDSFPDAQKTILKGLEYGKKQPIEGMEREILITASNAGIKPLDEVWAGMKHSFVNGKKRGTTTHFKGFDENFTWKQGEITLIIGKPNHGKTEFSVQLMLMKAVFEGWKWGIFSPENFPADEFYDTLIHAYIGKSTDPIYGKSQMSMEEYQRGYDFVSKHFFYIYPEDQDHTPEVIESAFLYLIETHKINGTLIDPFNQLETDYDGRDDLYLSRFLRKRKRFASKYGLCDIITTHPKSMARDKSGKYPAPEVYDIAGGAMWGNKMDNIMIVDRPNFSADPMDSTVEIIVRKIKKQKLVGVPGTCTFTFTRKTNRYYIDGVNPLETERVSLPPAPRKSIFKQEVLPIENIDNDDWQNLYKD